MRKYTPAFWKNFAVYGAVWVFGGVSIGAYALTTEQYGWLLILLPLMIFMNIKILTFKD